MSTDNERDAILDACCADGQAVQVVFESQGLLVRGAFGARAGDRLILSIWGQVEGEPSLPAACCVTFVRGTRTFAFVATAHRFSREAEGRASLSIDVPELVAAAEARRHPRLPVPPELPLAVEVAGADGVGHKGLGIDVSRGGMRVELIEGEATAEGLSAGSPVALRLGLEDVRLDLEGRVAHRTGGQLGVEIPDAAYPKMQALVRRIEDAGSSIP